MIRKTYYSSLLSLFLLCCLLVAGCTDTISPVKMSTTTGAGTPTVSPLPASQQTLKLFAEPDDGEGVILDAINTAHRSIWLETYLLTDTGVIQALENAAHRKLDVRVMLEPAPTGGGSPQDVLDGLKLAGAKITTASPDFSLTHEKGMVIDGNTAYIMTCNFTYSALNGTNREYGIIDSVAPDVREVVDIFNADWHRKPVHLTDSNLVVSPTNSRDDLTTLIRSAKHSLVMEEEEMYDSQIEQAIISAAKRGVRVQVILPTPYDASDTSLDAPIALLTSGGVQVRRDSQLYMHAKMIVVDGVHAFVGSENISSSSLDGNRELGILLTNAGIIASLQQYFETDWKASTR